MTKKKKEPEGVIVRQCSTCANGPDKQICVEKEDCEHFDMWVPKPASPEPVPEIKEPEDIPVHDPAFPVEKIKISDRNPRKHFDEGKLDELAGSIKESGVIEPITLQRKGDDYYLVIGERRLRATVKAGLPTINSMIRTISDRKAHELRLVENLNRVDLSPIEEASALKDLLDDGSYSQQSLAKKLGKSQTWISQRVKLLELPKSVTDLVISGAITPKHALVLAPICQKPKAVDAVVDKLKEQLKKGDTVTVDGMPKLISNVIWSHLWSPSLTKFDSKAIAVKIEPFNDYQLRHLQGHIDLSECKGCTKAFQGREGYNNEKVKYCLEPSCFSNKLMVAKTKFDVYQREQAKQLGIKGTVDTNQLRIDGISGFNHLGCKEFDETECHKCDQRKKDTSYRNSYVCVDTDCFNRKKKEAKSAKLRESKDQWSKTLIALDKATLPKQGGQLTALTIAQKRMMLRRLTNQYDMREALDKAVKVFGCDHRNVHEVLQDEDLDCALVRTIIMAEVMSHVGYGGHPSPDMVKKAVDEAVNPPAKTKKQMDEEAQKEAVEYAEDAPDCYGQAGTDKCKAESEGTSCPYWDDCHNEIRVDQQIEEGAGISEGGDP